MWPESGETKRPLRSGLTTGCCATACSLAAAQFLLAGTQAPQVSVKLPGGKLVLLTITGYETLKSKVSLVANPSSSPNPSSSASINANLNTDLNSQSDLGLNSKLGLTSSSTPTPISIPAPVPNSPDVVKSTVENNALLLRQQSVAGVRTSTIKDAGDDPDVTHGARVFVELSLRSQPGVGFSAAAGVGTVTRNGLVLAVGEPAINPVPRKMINAHLSALAEECNYQGGFEVAVGVEGGETLALKTMNGRLGILGGLSILGTTGIVRPFSCSAYIASIHQGIDVAKANGITHIAATTGSTSERFIQQQYQLTEMALIEMGDFVGGVLKYLKRAPVGKLSIAGGFGKISKLAAGHLDLHSGKSAIDLEFLAELAVAQGADSSIEAKIKRANTSIEALQYCQQSNINLADAVCQRALNKARSIVPEGIALEVWAVDRQGQPVGSAGVADKAN